MKNLERSELALKAILLQREPTVFDGIAYPCEESLTDLLANLRHFCFLNKIDFDNALEVSQSHFDAEKKDW